MRQRVVHRVHDGGEHGIGERSQPVVNPQTFTPGFHEARTPQIGEMPGCLRLRNLEALVDVADADLAREQQAEDAQPRRGGYNTPDKDAVLREAFRVLKPGGRFAVSDVVIRGEIPSEVRRSLELRVGCVAGALEEEEFGAKLRTAGFEDVEIEPWRVYRVEDARAFLTEAGLDVDALAQQVDGQVASAFIRGRKPAPAAQKSCCGPSCCQ